MSFLESMGLIAISLLVLYIIKKISDYVSLKRASYQQDDRVYKAAEEFVQGASSYVITDTLASCIDFDEEDVEEILAQSYPHKTEEDRGYSAFIKAVNKVLGEDVYSESRRTD